MCLAFPSADDWQWLQQDPPPAQGGRGWSGRTGLGNRWGRQELCLTVEEEALLFIMSRRTYQTRKNRHTTATAASSRTFFYLWEFSGRFSGLSCFKTKTLEGKTGGNDCHWSMTKQTEHLENKNMCRAMLLKNICRDFNPHQKQAAFGTFAWILQNVNGSPNMAGNPTVTFYSCWTGTCFFEFNHTITCVHLF